VYTSVRPESISEVDAATRDRWVVRTAEQTLDRVATMASALRSGLHGEELRERLVESGVDAGLASGVALAVEHYGTTSAYLRALRETALDAVRVVAGEREEVARVDLAPDEGGTDDAVLAGLAELDLGAAGPDLTADDSGVTSVDVGTDESREAAELAEATTTEPVTADAEPESLEPTDTGEETAEPEAESEPEPEPASGDAATETVEPTTEPEPAASPEPTAPVADSDTSGSETGSGDAAADATEGGAVESDDSGAVSAEPVESEDVDEADAGANEEFEEFEPGEFDLPEEERERVEAEFGTEFETGNEVEPAGEADIETPEPESEPESADAGTETGTGAEGGAAADVDVDEVTVEVIAELDVGDGADRDAVVSTVADRYGVDPEEVSEAIESAMMSGRAYEPSDGRLKAI
jgi:hypothetical protein